MVENLLYSFDFFTAKELFPNCSADEIKECIDNNYLPNVLTLAHHLDNIRGIYGKPIRITSSFRNFQHNRSCAGSSTSQHLKGCAMDFQPFKGWKMDDMNSLLDAIIKYQGMNPFISQLLVHRNYFHIGLLDDSSERLNHFSMKVYEPKEMPYAYKVFQIHFVKPSDISFFS